jgi:succinylglutamate desuccinylase
MVSHELQSAVKPLLIERGRIVFSCCGDENGPFVIFSAGIHGNEPSGVIALHNVFNEIVTQNIRINGSVLAFVGNRNALNMGQRYATVDLNRLWTDDNISRLHGRGFSDLELNPDILEMIKIDQLISDFENTAGGKDHYFIDLHTTSAPTVPFAVIDTNPECLRLANQFPLPVIINFNEYIKGTMLNYQDKRGFYGLVFEAGQHEDPLSIDKHEAIIWLTLAETKALTEKDIPGYASKYALLNGLSDDPHKQFKIIFRQQISAEDDFKLNPGFVNFQEVQKGEVLGALNGEPMLCPADGRMFMPLYQSKGEDGYYLVERV